ncbi:MAG: nucleoid-associated protein, partial [Bacteroidia bacterium]|nr:nucleoid-associated protein [Bacteroidia bacterium]
MIDFSRAQLTHFAVHFVGNKSLGEELTCSTKAIEFKDDFVKETLLRYFLNPFKTDIYYRFKGKVDVSLSSVANACEDLFGT